MVIYQVGLEIFNVSLIRVIIYAVSWAVKLTTLVILHRSKRAESIGKMKSLFIGYS